MEAVHLQSILLLTILVIGGFLIYKAVINIIREIKK